MKDFAAIDFETANRQRSSVCSVGVVIVRNGQVVDKIYRTIRPLPNFYSFFNTQVHGMTINLPLVAHNSPFDEGCLKAVFAAYGMEYPGYQFFCTCRAARRVLGKELPNHQLHTVSSYCGYELECHHHALADAEACAAIALKLL